MVEDKRGFVTPLRVESIDWKNWKILELFRFVGWKHGDVFEVYPGEVTDFATVPWWSQFILPRTGTWTMAAVLHDKMCNLLREYYRLMQSYRQLIRDGASPEHLVKPRKPAFTSIDADNVFRENARKGGTDPIRSELLWFGVRCGSLIDAHRRENWMRTFPRWFFDLVWIVTCLVGIVAFISWAWPW